MIADFEAWEPILALMLVFFGGLAYRMKINPISDFIALVVIFGGCAASLSYDLSRYFNEGTATMALGIMGIALFLTVVIALVVRIGK